MHATASDQTPVARVRPFLRTALWELWYLSWRPGSISPGPGAPVFVSLTDFRIRHRRHAPSAWLTGLRLRRSWPQLEGAVGLWLWSEPLRLRSGSVSIWQREEDLLQFTRSPVHRSIVRSYRDRMSGTSTGWTAPEFDRFAIWKQAVSRLTSGASGSRNPGPL